MLITADLQLSLWAPTTKPPPTFTLEMKRDFPHHQSIPKVFNFFIVGTVLLLLLLLIIQTLTVGLYVV